MVFWPIIAAIAAVVGSAATIGCAVYGSQNQKHNSEAKAAEDWKKNSCNTAFGTALDGNMFFFYDYLAKGDGLDCRNMPKNTDIEKEVESCAERFDKDGIDLGCCEQTIGKDHWKIRVSKYQRYNPVDKVEC